MDTIIVIAVIYLHYAAFELFCFLYFRHTWKQELLTQFPQSEGVRHHFLWAARLYFRIAAIAWAIVLWFYGIWYFIQNVL